MNINAFAIDNMRDNIHEVSQHFVFQSNFILMQHYLASSSIDLATIIFHASLHAYCASY